jgi:hypothetical protein
MSAIDVKSLPAGTLTTIEAAVWPAIKEKLAPIVWGWYEVHQGDRVTKIAGFYTVTISSFGIVALALTEIFGPRPAVSPIAPVSPNTPT